MSIIPDYDLPDEVHADTPVQMRALADRTRTTILDLVMERAATVTELAHALDRPKSSVAYHVDALVAAGLLRVVRTRRVRAIDERFYGRTGRTIVVGHQTMPTGARNANFLSEALSEVAPDADLQATLRHARVAPEHVDAFFARVVELAEDFTRLPREGDTVVGFVAALYPTDLPVLPAADDEPTP